MKLRISLIAIACAVASAALGMGSAKAATVKSYCIDGATATVSTDDPLGTLDQFQLDTYASLGGAYTLNLGTGPDVSLVDALGTLGYIVTPFAIPGGVFHPVVSGDCASAPVTTPTPTPDGTATGADAVPAPEGGIFLCYSKYQTDPGVWAADQATELLAQGYWKPIAVAGPQSATRFGPFSLVCNPGKQVASAPTVGVDSSGTIYTQPPSRLDFLDTYDFVG
ncbi:MAG: hypothetical protein QOH16_2297 [Gaiellaceae bacterium]|nr:hypothetical protein [Gaiellaceae bacterium]